MRKLSRRNKLRLTRVFKEGRMYFPKAEFSTLTYFCGMYAATPIGGAKCKVDSGINFEEEAAWGE